MQQKMHVYIIHAPTSEDRAERVTTTRSTSFVGKFPCVAKHGFAAAAIRGYCIHTHPLVERAC